MEVFGSTRSRVTNQYALLTPDTHVNSPIDGWTGATGIVHISPVMGARFLQYTAAMEAGGTSGTPGEGVERFIYFQSGACELKCGSETRTMTRGDFAYLPAGEKHDVRCVDPASLIVLEKIYIPHNDIAPPSPVIGSASDVPGDPFMGDPDARLQTLLPIEPAFDMAVNIFTYQPGATLPQVEIHVMEHGLQMLAGQGVYRLDEDHFPVTAGDVIWMASYCPQWFVAMGKTPASYIYYKDIHRDGLTKS